MNIFAELLFTMKVRIATIFFILPILFFSTTFLQGQSEVDSLTNLLNKDRPDTAKVLIYARLSQHLIHQNIDSALIVANQGLYLAKKIEYHSGTGDMYMSLGHIYIVNNDMFRALELYLKAADYFALSKFRDKLSVSFLLLGNVYYTIGNLSAAMDYYQRGLIIADSLQLTSLLADFYNNLGEVHSKLKNYPAAIDNLYKGLEIRQDANNQAGAAHIMVNISQLYLKLKNYDKALTYLNEANQLYSNLGHNEGLYNVYVGFGTLEQEQGNYRKAITYFKQGEKYLNNIGSEYLGPKSLFRAELYSSLGNCYLLNNDLVLAENYLLKSFEISEQTGQIAFMEISAQYLSELYEKVGQPIKALKYARLYKFYSDSISRDENVKRITQLEMQFEFDKKLREKEVEQSNIEARQKRKELIYIMFSTGIFLALIILFMFFRIQKLKVKKISLEKKDLMVDLDYKNKELTTNVMYLLKKNEFILSISDKLKKIRYNFKPDNRKIVDDIIQDLERSISEGAWQDFELRFQEVHADFYQKLTNLYPDLSPNELKLCAFLRLNMSTKEISTITFQSINSINMARFRLRKKMGIGSYDNLIAFLGQL
jgi:tetratricopeptide (TPR) repeat protein